MTITETNGSTAPTRATRPDHEVVVVGAGFSGIGAAIKLKAAGIHDFVILERAGDVGGCWRDNHYPGIAVDIPSFTYSYSFEPNPNWSRTYAPGAELEAYAQHCVDKYRLRPHLRLRTEVVGGYFDEDNHWWRISLSDGHEITTRFVLSATGGINQPKRPDIDGLDDFAGKVIHTARWDHEYDLRGKRVAVIGTGASAVQLVPSIAPIVGQLHVFQRTPIWVFPKPDVGIPSLVRDLFRYVPPTQRAARLVTSTFSEAVMVLGAMYNKQLPMLIQATERICREHLKRQVPDPELRARLTPNYGFWCKRPSFSNDYLRTYMRDDVELVTDGIERITATGIRTVDGRLRKVDTLVLATGFKVFELGNIPPFPVIGRDGVDLGPFWDEERYQAYEGITVPRFPNTFSILGPYSLTGSSYFSMIEASSTHAVRCITEARRRGATFVEVRQEPHDRYFADILRRQQNTVFYNNNCGTANSYFFDRHGDAPMMRPSTGVEMWWRARHFPFDHYEFRSPAGREAARRDGLANRAVQPLHSLVSAVPGASFLASLLR